MKNRDVQLAMNEARRLRDEARLLPTGELRKNVEDAADRLEKVAQQLERESMTTEKANK